MSSAIETLDDNHYSLLHRAIFNVLDTDLAHDTYQQIIDGLPTADVAWDRSRHKLEASHPIADHTNLCPGVKEKLSAIKADFKIDSLTFDPSTLKAFQSASPSSHSFHLRLIELTAVALHQIAVTLFQLHLNLHDRSTSRGLDVDAVVKWQPEPDDFFVSIEPWPTLFAHRYFTAHEQYPNGVADMVGYWAEDRILGGVALFDRSQSWSEDSDEPDVYFHSCRMQATWRIWQLLPDQQQGLVDFLVQESRTYDGTAAPDGPFPIMPSRANTVRIDPIEAIPVRKVYRDIWEREEPPKLLRMQEDMAACVVRPDDYPEMEDTDDLIKRLNEQFDSSHP
ncbi:hypothetical protein N0V82_009502 [Gnomoniopsis sp. IMI 355080]|nr:hypothetical protein N0V82_009502 [Gnomoniopsis sp. IMI 355080]